MKLPSWILICFQHCCSCGAIALRYSHLCSKCQAEIQAKIRTQLDLGYCFTEDCRGFPMLSLGLYRDFILCSWIKALKGGGNRDDYQYLVTEWVRKRQFLLDETLVVPILIVPSPSRNLNGRDHALCLAEALSLKTGWKMGNHLKFQEPEHKSQKNRRAIERLDRKYILHQPLPEGIGSVIFVDDVVTTGSTALAGWIALGSPVHFEVWCIAHQPMLAGRKQF